MSLHIATVWRRLVTIGLMAACLTLLVGPAQAAARLPAAAACGVWTVDPAAQPKDRLIAVDLVSGPTGNDCQALFHVTNKTDVRGFGGYGLQLMPSEVNARSEWTPPGDAGGKTFLFTPPLDVDLRAIPLDPSQGARVSLSGEPTIATIVIDTGFFVLNAIFDAVPLPTGCVISQQQVEFIALRDSDILASAVTLALKGNLPGARTEFAARSPEFIQQAGGYAKDAGASCVADYFKHLVGKPVVVIKIAVEFGLWIPLLLFRWWKYQDQPASLGLNYTPPPSVPTPTPTAAALPTASASAGKVYLGSQLLLDVAMLNLGCTNVAEISYSPTRDNFLVVLQCFEGDNEAFLFRADGKGERRVTARWDYFNYTNVQWAVDGESFTYQRSNSCCAVPPADAPPLGLVRYEIATGRKTLVASPTAAAGLFRVINVASNDVLNVRSAPGAGRPLVGTIPPDATGIQITGDGVQQAGDFWVPIRYQGLAGWVNVIYLAQQ